MTVRILLATTNSYKISEIRSLLSDCPVELVGLDELGFAGDEPLEDGLTFEANAIKKGCFYAIQTNCLCLSDDSGLEVDVLGGEPGVRSAQVTAVGRMGRTEHYKSIRIRSWARSNSPS